MQSWGALGPEDSIVPVLKLILAYCILIRNGVG